MKVLVTGASGLLGRAVLKALQQEPGLEAEGWCRRRREGGALRSVELRDSAALGAAFAQLAPDVVVHCAAERRPDAIGKDPHGSKALNAGATAALAALLSGRGGKDSLLLYISTDYVFDGTQPPYYEDAEPNPVNEYGELKLAGEAAVRATAPRWAILRVPILYGPVSEIGEGAVDALLKPILAPGTPAKVDNVQRRFPTHVADVAQAIAFLLRTHAEKTGSVEGVFHFSGAEEMSKVQMAHRIAKALQLPSGHLSADEAEPSGGVRRPKDARLANRRLAALGFPQPHRDFDAAAKDLYAGLLKQ